MRIRVDCGDGNAFDIDCGEADALDLRHICRAAWPNVMNERTRKLAEILGSFADEMVEAKMAVQTKVKE